MRELSEDDIQAVLGVVEGLALDAADGDTSIPQERLARIMAAVRYCMGEGEACLGEASGESLARRIPADELYRAGYDSIVEKAERALERYNQVARHGSHIDTLRYEHGCEGVLQIVERTVEAVHLGERREILVEHGAASLLSVEPGVHVFAHRHGRADGPALGLKAHDEAVVLFELGFQYLAERCAN